ncbi:hypothetical protein HGRIS_002332 [Hohenbuehelia grisea]|uniref:Carboxylic ester hydrolase n=1 Tax=Hohenbuehelia grisea TaxID=104357 RepID=A0ABR3JKD1_9AGAR
MLVTASFLTVVAAFAHVQASSPSSTAVPVVDLGYAKYQGTYNVTTNTANYLGIRFAAPPIGSLRWQRPQPPSTVSGVQAATQQPIQCPQVQLWGKSPTNPFRNSIVHKRATSESDMSEDCLFLNVHYPGNTPSKKRLPVLVWIHGGGYGLGNASDNDGSDLIVSSGHDIVVVVIQYRLGIFGFLSSAQVKANGALNAGLLDQEFALQWVQQHIHKFGGDRTKVTIWGESAGAGSVLFHTIAHNGRTWPPLFKGAIGSSSVLQSHYRYDDSFPEAVFREVVTQANCSPATQSLECLRNADWSVLQAANVNITNSALFGTFPAIPVVDGDFITERPSVLLKRGKVNGERLLAITNANEGFSLVDRNRTDVDVANFVREMFPLFTDVEARMAAETYAGLGTAVTQLMVLLGDFLFHCPTYIFMDAFKEKSWKGLFAVPPALHGQDLTVYFPNTPIGIPHSDFNNQQFSNAFTHAFLNFAKTLDPNPPNGSLDITPNWRQYSTSQPIEMLFNRTEDYQPDVRPILSDPAMLRRCAFWDSVAALTGQ